MTYTTIYYRYGGRYERQDDTLEQALFSAAMDHDQGTAWVEKILDEDGEVVADKEALFAYYCTQP